MSTEQHDNKPWYKHRWLWVLIGIPTTSVVLGVVLITVAINNPAILVVDNYYAEGRGINRSMALDDAASERALSARLSVAGASMQLQLLSNNRPYTREEALSLYVYHVTEDSLDQVFTLAPAADPALSEQGYFELASAQQQDALISLMAQNTSWYLEIRGVDNDWRLRQRISTPLQEVSF